MTAPPFVSVDQLTCSEVTNALLVLVKFQYHVEAIPDRQVFSENGILSALKACSSAQIVISVRDDQRTHEHISSRLQKVMRVKMSYSKLRKEEAAFEK